MNGAAPRCYAAAPFPSDPMTPLSRTLMPLLLALGSAGAAAQAGHAHVHGEVAMEIVIEPRALSLRLEAPQDSLLGHERAPRSAAEKQAAAALLQRLADGAALFPLPADRGCRLASTEVVAPQLQSATKPAADGHAEVDASWRFECTRTDGLRSLDLGPLLDAFARIQRVTVQVAGSGGQHKTQLRRPARTLAWGR